MKVYRVGKISGLERRTTKRAQKLYKFNESLDDVAVELGVVERRCGAVYCSPTISDMLRWILDMHWDINYVKHEGAESWRIWELDIPDESRAFSLRKYEKLHSSVRTTPVEVFKEKTISYWNHGLSMNKVSSLPPSVGGWELLPKESDIKDAVSLSFDDLVRGLNKEGFIGEDNYYIKYLKSLGISEVLNFLNA